MKYAPIQLSSLKAPISKAKSKSVNYTQGFWYNESVLILKKIRAGVSRFSKNRPPIKALSNGLSLKRVISFKLRWYHVVIAFLIGALIFKGHGNPYIIRSQIRVLSPAPAYISVKPLPLLKEAAYKPFSLLDTIWIDKRRPVGTYANNYAPFNCTWYVASRLPVPDSMGNANNWAYAASLAGYTVSSTPKVGAIAQTAGDSYLGHVAIVESINPDGSFIVSEMNYDGPGIVDSRLSSTAEFPSFIYV